MTNSPELDAEVQRIHTRDPRRHPRPAHTKSIMAWRRLAQHSLLRNSAFLISTTTSTSLLGYLYWWAAARTASPSSVGLATGVVSALGLTAQVGTLGARYLAIQMLPSLEGRAWPVLLWKMVTWTAAVSFGAAIAVAAALARLSANFAALQRPALLIAFCLGAALTAAATVIDGALISLRRSSLQFLRNLIQAITKLILLVVPWLVTRNQSAEVIVWTWVGALLISVCAGMAVLLPPAARLWPRWGDLNPRPFFSQWRLLAGNLATSMSALLPIYAFPVMVVAYLDAEQNAYYYLTWSASAAFLMISPAIANALFAETSAATEVRKQVRVATVAILALLLPATVGIILLAHPLLSVFGHEYAERGTALLRINAVAAFPDAVTNIYIALMLARRQVSRAALVNFAIGLAAIGGAALTLRTLGINAVGWSWLGAQTLGVLVMLVSLRRSRRSQRSRTATAAAQA
jgi:O-antigen/teichoic acid export membrane protein